MSFLLERSNSGFEKRFSDAAKATARMLLGVYGCRPWIQRDERVEVCVSGGESEVYCCSTATAC